MKIALVHDFIQSFGGAERVLQDLHQLYPEAPIYTLLANPQTVQAHFPQATIYTSSLQHSWLRTHPQFLLPRLPRAIEEFDLRGFERVISSSGAFAHGVITGPQTHHICYCHSPMRYAWDWQAEYLQEHGIRGGIPLFAASNVLSRLRVWDYVAAKRVDHWLANSQTVQARIEKFYGAQSQLLYPPVDTEFFQPESTSRGKNYAITVSRLSRYKRVELIIAACAAAKLPLQIVGTGSERRHLQAYAAELQADVQFLGGINDHDLRTALDGACCFIFAAEEDFGIAPVEALSMGVPVIALNKGGTAESVQPGKTGILYPEPTIDALQRALQQFLTDGVSSSSSAIRTSAQRFSRGNFSSSIRKIVEYA